MIQEAHDQRLPPPRRRVRHAGYLLGAGLAGILEGAVFHEILGWHHFADASSASDGAFQFAMWTLVVLAVGMLWRARARFAEPRAGSVLVGSALVGAGSLEMADAVIARWLLRLHWLHPQGDVGAWEAGFFVVSALVALGGAWLLVVAARTRTGFDRRARRRATRGA